MATLAEEYQAGLDDKARLQKEKDELIAKLKNQYGDIYELNAETGEDVIIREPTEGEVRAFRDSVNSKDQQKSVQALERLLRAVIVYPLEEKVLAMFSKRNGLVEAFGNKVTWVAGHVQQVELKKL